MQSYTFIDFVSWQNNQIYFIVNGNYPTLPGDHKKPGKSFNLPGLENFNDFMVSLFHEQHLLRLGLVTDSQSIEVYSRRHGMAVIVG